MKHPFAAFVAHGYEQEVRVVRDAAQIGSAKPEPTQRRLDLISNHEESVDLPVFAQAFRSCASFIYIGDVVDNGDSASESAPVLVFDSREETGHEDTIHVARPAVDNQIDRWRRPRSNQRRARHAGEDSMGLGWNCEAIARRLRGELLGL